MQFHEFDKKARDLAGTRRTIEEFLRQERNEQEQNIKRKKNGDLEWSIINIKINVYSSVCLVEKFMTSIDEARHGVHSDDAIVGTTSK